MLMDKLRVGELMAQEMVTLPLRPTVGEVLEVLKANGHQAFPVVGGLAGAGASGGGSGGGGSGGGGAGDHDAAAGRPPGRSGGRYPPVRAHPPFHPPQARGAPRLA